MVVKILVSRHESSSVVHLLELAIKRRLLIALGSSTNKEDFDPRLITSIPLT